MSANRGSWRRRTGAACALLVSLLLAPAASPRPDRDPLDETREAIGKKGDALAEFLARPDTDAWALVDDLLATGDRKTALAVARTTPHDAGALDRYLTAPPPVDRSARAAFAEAREAATDGRFEDAIRALEHARAPEGSILRLRVEALGGRVLLELDRYEEARAAMRRAAKEAHRLGRDAIGEFKRIEDRFQAILTAGRFREAHRLTPRLIDVAGMTEDLVRLFRAQVGVASADVQLDLADEALPRLRRAAKTFALIRDAIAPRSARFYGADLRMLHCQAAILAGRFVEAFEAGETALRLAGETGEPVMEAAALEILAEASAAIGANDDAVARLRGALELLPDSDELAVDRLRLRVNLGRSLRQCGLVEQALGALEACRRELAGSGLDRGSVVTLVTLGEIHEEIGRWSSALALYEEAADLAGTDMLYRAYVAQHRGDALSRRGAAHDPAALREAEVFYEQAGRLLGDLPEPGLRLSISLGRGEIALARGEAEKALTWTRAALEVLEGLTNGLADGEMVQSRSHPDRSRLFRLGLRSALAIGRADLVFEMMERSRAGAFLAALGGRRALIERASDPRWAAELRRSSRTLAERYAEHRAARAEKETDRALAALERVSKARMAHEHLLQELERQARKTQSLPGLGVATLEKVQGSLGAHEVMVLYALLPDRSCALVVTTGKARLVPLPGRTKILRVCEEAKIEDCETKEALESRLARLRALLLAPLALPETTKTVLVAPDAVLAHLPWPLLLDPGGRGARRASLIPSGTTFGMLRDREAAAGRGRAMLAVGNPRYRWKLGGVRHRVYGRGRALRELGQSGETVTAMAKKGDVVLLAGKATETRLLLELGGRKRWRSVHLACHCLLNEQRPSLSALALAPDDENDGFLTAGEIATTRFPSDLVVLSACATGRDRAATGEGLLGLVRATMIAGAPRVVASLWPVGDHATGRLMLQFHRAWGDGARVTEALRQAQINCRNATPDPRAWAAWVVWGLPD